MAHDHDEHGHGEADAEPPIKGKQYWEIAVARRARPQYDPVEVAREYLDEMEKAGRLHGKKKRS